MSASATLDAPPSVAATVAVGIDDLIIGRPITEPIIDEQGILLLAAGAVITSEFKRLLRQRNLQEVQVNRADVSSVTLNTEALQDIESFSFDNALTQQLDRIIDDGMLPIRNVGPAVRDSMVSLGRNAYDQKQRERLVQRNEQNNQALQAMMDGVAKGGAIDGSAAANVANTYLSEMRSDLESVLTSTASVLDDTSLSAQALQTSLLAMALGIELGLDTENVRTLGLIGLVHDWGMMKVPQEVRDASRPLSAEHRFEISKHPIHTLEFLERSAGIPAVVSLVSYQIHERLNGSGYPRGRAGKAIHQFARIVAVADTYTALTSQRPWRPPYMPYAAMDCVLRETKNRNLDAGPVRALLQVLSLFPLGSLIALSDGSVARVLRRNGTNYMTPIVQRLQNSQGQRVDHNAPENILDLTQSPLRVAQALPTPGRRELSLSEALKIFEEESR